MTEAAQQNAKIKQEGDVYMHKHNNVESYTKSEPEYGGFQTGRNIFHREKLRCGRMN